jgi:hypothetical protein
MPEVIMSLKYSSSKISIMINLIVLIVMIGLNQGCTENRFLQQSFESDQSEVIHILQQINIMERAYHQENGVYLACPDNNSFTILGMEIPDNAVYEYSVVLAEDGFISTATANLDEDPTLDIWISNEGSYIACTSDDVLN